MRSVRLGASSLLLIALTAALAGCAPTPAATPTSAPDPTASATSEPVGTEPLTCAEVATPETLAAALTGADGVAPEVVEAVQPSYAIELASLTGAGGFACSWRAGEGETVMGDEQGDWAYLTVRILPDAAKDWVAPYAGDTPSDEHRMIGDVEATTTAGESGWVISAPVGSAWVDVTVTASRLISGGGRFEGDAFDRVLDGITPVAESTFSAIQTATAEQLAWPALPFREGEPLCNGGLDQVGIESALMLGGTPAEYTVIDARTQTLYGLADAVDSRIGTFTCQMFAEGYGYTDITVLRDFAPAIAEFATLKDIASALDPVVLDGAGDGEIALEARREDGPSSPLYFTLGQTLYLVQSDGPATVAEAIIAQTR
jgi:hypothetical protein